MGVWGARERRIEPFERTFNLDPLSPSHTHSLFCHSRPFNYTTVYQPTHPSLSLTWPEILSFLSLICKLSADWTCLWGSKVGMPPPVAATSARTRATSCRPSGNSFSIIHTSIVVIVCIADLRLYCSCCMCVCVFLFFFLGLCPLQALCYAMCCIVVVKLS